MLRNAGNEIFLYETLTILLLAIFGCLFSFLYEIGFFIVFGIPIKLLGVNSHNILLSIMVTFCTGIFSVPFIYLIFRCLSDKNKLLLYNLFLILIVPFDLLMMTIYVLTKTWNLLIVIIVILLGAIFSKYFMFLIIGSKRYRYINIKNNPGDFPIPGYTEYNVKIDSNTVNEVIQEKESPDMHTGTSEQEPEGISSVKAHLIVIALLGMLSIISSAIGIIQAKTEDEFYVVNTNPEMVVLRIYGDKLVCAPFDRKTKKIYRTFAVKKIGGFGLKMTPEKIGTLSTMD